MTPEIEAEIRRLVEAHKAAGKKLARSNYANCIVGAIGGIAAAIDWLGEAQTIALECGFEGFDMGGCAKLHPEFYALGKKIAEENGCDRKSL